MSTQAVTTFFSLLALASAATALVVAGMWVAGRVSTAGAGARDAFFASIETAALPLAWLIAAVSMAGSLYYSEVVGFEPCVLCWYQRIGMYPLAVILGVAALRRDPSIRWYALPLAVAGGGISVYHYVIQQFPDLDAAGCSATLPCTTVYVERFGFITIAFMAMAAFAAIVALVLVARPRRGG